MRSLRKIIEVLPPWVFTAAVLLAILYLTLVPRPLPPMKILMFPHSDKVVHALMFGAVVVAMILDYVRKGGTHLLRFTLFSLATSVAIGGIIELLQSCMGMGRSGDWYDFMADAAGAALCAFSAPLIARFFK